MRLITLPWRGRVDANEVSVGVGWPYRFFFLNRTPGTSPLVNSIPAASSARQAE
jgi:hypothetical protein